MALRFDDAFAATRDLDEAHPQLVEQLRENLALLRRQVAAGLLLQERQDFDHLRGALQVRLGARARERIWQVAEMDRGRAPERQHKRGERERRRRIGHLIKITKCPTPSALLRRSPVSLTSWRHCAGRTG